MHTALIGLGNPDAKYSQNRHNIGFMFVDWLKEYLTTNYQLPASPAGSPATHWKYDKYTRAELAKIQLPMSKLQLPIILAKPQTYMNNSGESVGKIMSNTDIDLEHLFVIHDDLDLRIGQFKIQMGIGPKRHNGIESIEHHLKTKEFWRIRIGIDNRIQGKNIPGEQYVLSNFSKEEHEEVEALFPQIVERLSMVVE